jgi:3-phenylpropionate/cinnamic acid dioxygenase small subunit
VFAQIKIQRERTRFEIGTCEINDARQRRLANMKNWQIGDFRHVRTNTRTFKVQGTARHKNLIAKYYYPSLRLRS